jgi:selenoprotein W-related protein
MAEREIQGNEVEAAAEGTRARVVIEYCPRCGWLLRAAWLAQELLTTFHAMLSEVALKPAEQGVFRICVDEHLVWSRREEGGFPSAAELKRRVRDVVAPGLPLGHVDGGDK